jgi:hypothetical protein
MSQPIRKDESIWEIRDEKGSLILREKSNSWLENWAKLIYAVLRGGGTTLTDTDGSSLACVEGHSAQYATRLAGNAAAGAGSVLYGLLAGTGDTGVEYDDDSIETLIAHGTDPTQLEYGAVTVNAPAYASGILTITVTRAVTNSSGSSITVKEVGCAVFHYSNPSYGGAAGYALIDRHILTTPIEIQNGKTFTLTWTIAITSA